MANPISKNMSIGTIGELLVQIRLLQHGVQAAPPLKDSGNDLIAIKGRCVKFVQVKTTTNNGYNLRNLKNKIFDILALVKLSEKNNELQLDKSEIYLLGENELIINNNDNYTLPKNWKKNHKLDRKIEYFWNKQQNGYIVLEGGKNGY